MNLNTNRLQTKIKIRINIFLLAAGMGLAVIGWLFMLLGQDQAARDTVPTTATVTEYVEGTDTRGRMMVTVYYPVVTYEANGQTVTSEYSESFDDPVINVGDTVSIKYNPDDPQEFIMEGDEVDTGSKGLFAIVLGGLMAVVGLVWTIVEKSRAGKKH